MSKIEDKMKLPEKKREIFRSGNFNSLNLYKSASILCWLIIVFFAFLSQAGEKADENRAMPDRIKNSDDFRWILFDREATGNNNGLFSKPEGGTEGATILSERGGLPCRELVCKPSGASYWYFNAGDYKEWIEWVKDMDVKLICHYYDDIGSISVQYDANLPVKNNGLWSTSNFRTPPALEKNIDLTGSGEWRIAEIDLPMPRFKKGCNGNDFRFMVVGAKQFALKAVALQRIPSTLKLDKNVLLEQSIPLTFETKNNPSGAHSSGNFLRIKQKSVQSQGNPIVLEMENASELQANISVDPRYGIYYADNISQAVFTFKVAKAGTYRLWYHSLFPWGGNWNHAEQLDSNPSMNFTDHLGELKKEINWEWVKGLTYKLTAGEHTFSLSYTGGAKLDKIVFIADGEEPQSFQKNRNLSTNSASYSFTSNSVMRDNIQQWTGIYYDQSNLPPTRILFSVDEGKTSRPYKSESDLQQIQILKNSPNYLKVKLEWDVKEGQVLPILIGPRVNYLRSEIRNYALTDKKIGMTLSDEHIVSINNVETGEAMVSNKQLSLPVPMFELGVKEPGNAELRCLSNLSAYCKPVKDSGSDNTVFTYVFENGISVEVKFSKGEPGRINGQLEITNNSNLEIAEVDFPILPLVKIGNASHDDHLFTPGLGKSEWINPSTLGKKNVSNNGPGMRWTDCWDENSGIYLGTHDDRLNDTWYVHEPQGLEGVKIQTHQKILIAPGSTWQSGKHVIAAHGGNWYEGADIYKQYIATQVKPCDTHPLYQWIDAWQTGRANELTELGFSLLTKDSTWTKQSNFQLLANWRYMADGPFTYCGLYPCVSPIYGTAEEFSSNLQLSRFQGIAQIFYMNWRLWVPPYSSSPRAGIVAWKDLPAGDPHQKPVFWEQVGTRNSYLGQLDTLSGFRFIRSETGVNIGSPIWRDRLYFWTMKYLDWNADGMYFDQTNMLYPNYQLHPGYDTYGCWQRATRDTLKRIRIDAKSKNPYYVCVGEAVMDTNMQYLDFGLASGVNPDMRFLRYCLPDAKMFYGDENNGLCFGQGKEEKFLLNTWQLGARFGYFPPWREKISGQTESPAYSLYLKLLQLRRMTKSLIYPAEFLDERGVLLEKNGKTVSSEDQLNARLFKYNQSGMKGLLLNCINTKKETACLVKVKLPADMSVNNAWSINVDGKIEPLQIDKTAKDVVKFTMPNNVASTVILNDNILCLYQWDNMVVNSAPSEKVILNGTVTNISDKAQQGYINIDDNLGEKGIWGSLNPGDSKQVALSLVAPGKIGRHDFNVNILADGKKAFTAYYCLNVHPAVLAQLDGVFGKQVIKVTNASSKPYTVAINIDVKAPLKASVAEKLIEVAPLSIQNIPLTLTGNEELSWHQMLRIVVESKDKENKDAYSQTILRSVFPALPNGDFESDGGVGDGYPEGWLLKDGTEFRLDMFSLADKAHNGKFCLSISPSNTGKYTELYNVIGAAPAGRSCTLSFWVKQELPGEISVYGSAGHKKMTLDTKSPELNEWRECNLDFTANGTCLLRVQNLTQGKIFIDDVKITVNPLK